MRTSNMRMMNIEYCWFLLNWATYQMKCVQHCRRKTEILTNYNHADLYLFCTCVLYLYNSLLWMYNYCKYYFGQHDSIGRSEVVISGHKHSSKSGIYCLIDSSQSIELKPIIKITRTNEKMHACIFKFKLTGMPRYTQTNTHTDHAVP